MADEQSPAPVVEAPTSTSDVAPVAEDAPSTTAPAPVAAAEAAPKPAEPDIDSLVQNEELRRQLLKHPELVKEIEHRVKSAEGRMQAALKAQNERERAEAAAKAERERQERDDEEMRKLIEDDYSSPLAQRMRTQLEERTRQRVAAEEQTKLREQMMPVLYAQVAEQVAIESLAPLVGSDGNLTDEDRKALSPYQEKYRDPQGRLQRDVWAKDVVAALTKGPAKEMAKTMAKELAKAEAAALAEERLGQEREKAAVPAKLPEGSNQSDSDFLADYANGRSSDHSRAMRLLGRT